MDLTFLPKEIYNEIVKLNLDKLTEIRLRIGYPILLKYDNKTTRLNLSKNYIIATREHINTIIENITEKSIYAFNNCIKQGFLSTKDGVRVGLCGNCVFDNEKIVTINDFSSLNIRIPHLIKDCSKHIISYLLDGKHLLNTLIISAPAKGKTTLLKDITIKLNELNYENILVIDERNEFSRVTGEFIDKITYSDKYFAFTYSLRSMSPEIIITDELSSEKDWLFTQNAVNSGIKLIASCHANNLNELKNKEFFIKDVFDRYVFLKNTPKAGVLDKVYDRKFKVICE